MSPKYRERVHWAGQPFVQLFMPSVGLLYFGLYIFIWIQIRQSFTPMIEIDSTIANSADFKQVFAIWTNPWIVLVVGLLMGFVTTGIMYFIRRWSFQFHTEALVLHPSQRFRWNVSWRSILYFSPVMIMGFVGAALGLLQIVSPSVIFVSWIPLGLLYFEQKKIYRTAKSMLMAETEQTDDLAGEQAAKTNVQPI